MHESLKKPAIPVVHFFSGGKRERPGFGLFANCNRTERSGNLWIFHTAAFLERADGVFCMHCIRYVHLILVGIGPGPFQIEIDRALEVVIFFSWRFQRRECRRVGWTTDVIEDVHGDCPRLSSES